MAIELSDVLESGDISDIVLANNIQFVQASGEEAQNTFMRIGANGLISLYRAPDQDIVWSGSNTFSIPLSTTEQTLVGLTVTEDTSALDGSFSLSGSITNSNPTTDVILTLSVYDDDIFIGSENMTIKSGDTNKLFLFSGGLYADIAGGSAITARFTASQNGALTLNGAVTPTRFTITKAQAAPVQMSVDNGTLFRTASNLGITLNRVEILGVIGTERPKSFGIVDSNGRGFLVMYDSEMDKFYYERLTEAT